MKQNPTWTGCAAFPTYKIKEKDNSVIEKTRQLFYGCYFFYDDELVEDSRIVYDIKMMLSSFGGTVSLIMVITSTLCNILIYIIRY